MIEPRYGVLKTLFADRVFRIPHYQRFYSWQNRQREDLFADIKKLATGVEDQHHFNGYSRLPPNCGNKGRRGSAVSGLRHRRWPTTAHNADSSP